VVRLDGELIETTEMFLVPVLNPGRTDGRFTFIPRRGWQAGTYEMSIQLYEVSDRFDGGQFLYDETSIYEFVVPASVVEGSVNILQLALLIVSGGLFLLLIVFLGLLMKDRYFSSKKAMQ